MGHSVQLSVGVPGGTTTTSARIVELGLRFGVALTVRPCVVVDDLEVDLRPGSITLVTGPSGAGKSILMGELAKRCPTSRQVHLVPFPQDVAVVDAVAPRRPLAEALELLTACGLGEPTLWLKRFNELSDGEQFRARLARTISLHRKDSRHGLLLCDEFGANLQRRLSKAIAFNLRKLVTREGLTLVVATSHGDVETDLQPDQVIRLGQAGTTLEAKTTRRSGAISFARRLRIETGSLRDYATFSAMHYRQREQIGFVDKVFVMRQGAGGEPLGVVVYGRPSLESAPRNHITAGRFTRNAARLNRELRVLKRLVIHPDVRGCGLAHWLVRRTLPMVGTRYVECLAAMGAVNPVFVKAGMMHVGACRPSASQKEILAALRSAGADPLAADFATQVCRRPNVRRLVATAVFDWYRGMTGGGEQRVARQSPRFLAQTFRRLVGSQPEYFIWAAEAGDRRGLAKRLKRN